MDTIITDAISLVSSGSGLTAGALTVAIIMILKGQLVPISVVKDVKAAQEEWQKAWREEREMRKEVESTLSELVRQGQTTMHFIDSLPTPHEKPRKRNAPNEEKSIT